MLDAAERLFTGHGYALATMEQIAEEAGFTKRTVYGYFAGKEDLLAGVVLRGLRRLNDLTREYQARQSRGIGLAYACGRAFFQFQRENAGLYSLFRDARALARMQGTVTALSPEMGRALMDESARNLEYLAAAIAAGRADGTIRKELEPQSTALLVQCISGGILEIIDKAGPSAVTDLPEGREGFLEQALAFIGAALVPSGSDMSALMRECETGGRKS